MASFDTGRLCAIVKILDQAGAHLRLAAGEQAHRADSTDTSAITSLLALAERAASGVRRAIAHLHAGETGQAQLALQVAGSGVGLDVPSVPGPLPGRVTTALQLMRGISGFFTPDTEEFLVRQLRPAGGRVVAGAH
ncbi:hypothetical protein [Streptomyces indicus]|uniref:Uncharacterized protein n=1 Tax=Streptomyces indicus TaxID=417292 RepID=A0A1G8T473_9ACTN|nr:hypothetical protein [Streptomyces indicus]SDJ35765.1 hypothetical protein SAMN05421806_10119 [Streptomyces indicus]